MSSTPLLLAAFLTSQTPPDASAPERAARAAERAAEAAERAAAASARIAQSLEHVAQGVALPPPPQDPVPAATESKEGKNWDVPAGMGLLFITGNRQRLLLHRRSHRDFLAVLSRSRIALVHLQGIPCFRLPTPSSGRVVQPGRPYYV